MEVRQEIEDCETSRIIMMEFISIFLSSESLPKVDGMVHSSAARVIGNDGDSRNDDRKKVWQSRVFSGGIREPNIETDTQFEDTLSYMR